MSTPQLRLALTRDPRISTGKKTSPTKLSPLEEERKGTVTPSIGVVNLVGGAKIPSRPKLSQVQHASTSVNKLSSSPPTLTQTHLFSKAKQLPVIPKLKSDVVLYGDLKSLTTSVLLPQASQSSHPHLDQKLAGEKNQVAQYYSSTLPPPLIKLLSRVQNKQPQTKASTCVPVPSVITDPRFTGISLTSTKHQPLESDTQSDDILPPKAKKVKTALLPISRIKTIMKTNMQSPQPTPQLSQESVLVITKATVSLQQCNSMHNNYYCYYRSYSFLNYLKKQKGLLK